MYTKFFIGKEGRMPLDTFKGICRDSSYNYGEVLNRAIKLGYRFNSSFYATIEGVVDAQEARDIIDKTRIV